MDYFWVSVLVVGFILILCAYTAFVVRTLWNRKRERKHSRELAAHIRRHYWTNGGRS
jgi:hypothetical protein